MDQRRRPSHLHVADLTCLHCAEKDAELQRKAEIIRDLQLELNKAMADLAGQTEAARAAGKAAVAAKGHRTRQAREEARLELVADVVKHWRQHRPRTGPEFGQPGSKSFDVIEKAIVLMRDDPDGPVKACCEAIDGLHLAPWQEFDQRYAKPGGKRVLRNGVEHALGDETRIARCRRIVRWARLDEARAFDVWRAVCETERAWLEVWRREHDRRLNPPAGEMPVAVVDGVVTRLEEER